MFRRGAICTGRFGCLPQVSEDAISILREMQRTQSTARGSEERVGDTGKDVVLRFSRTVRRMQSLRSAMLTQVVETAGRTVACDFAASRLLHTQARAPLTYLGARRLHLPDDVESALEKWIADEAALMSALLGDPIVDEVASHAPGKSDSAWPDAVFHRHANDYIRPHHALSLRCVVTPDERLVVLFFRCDESPSFTSRDRRSLQSLLRHIVAAMQQASAAEAQTIDASAMPTSLERGANAVARLSKTEQRVLCMLRQELTEREIARRLKRSPHTVHVHVKSIYRKLDISSRRELLALLTALEQDEQAPPKKKKSSRS